jgi:hypothetical protein
VTTDLRLSITFRDHPKVVKLHKMHGEAGISSLVTLWANVAAYRPKGILYGMDLMDVEIAARWPGENGVFILALHDLRLIDCPACPPRELWTPHGIVLPVAVHDWADHQGWLFYADERSERGRAAAAARWGKRDTANLPCESHDKECGSHEKGMQDALKSDAPSPSPLPSPPPKKTPSSEILCGPHKDLPLTTTEALKEVEPEGKRTYVRALITSGLAGGRSLTSMREALTHERLPADLIARIVGPMQETQT